MGPPPLGGEHDRHEFEILIEGYSDRLYSIALRITSSAEDAEDAVQDAVLSAYQSWARFRGEARSTTWLYRIVVNAALERVRRRRPEDYLTATGYEEAEVVDWSEDLARRVEDADLREMLERGITLLPEELRVALVLRDVEGLSTTDSAGILDISEAALKSRLHRARVLLRQWVAGYLDRR
jgi:RNA polymerase sigma-70 factor (ECF subfamily)